MKFTVNMFAYLHSNSILWRPARMWLELFARVSGRFAYELFRQRLVRQRLRSIRQRPKSLRQRPTGQFANV